MLKTLLPSIASLAFVVPQLAAEDRVLRAELVLDAPVEEVWRVWTTKEGLESFFAPDCRIDPKVDGVFEVWFNAAAPAGQRGADDMRILAFEPLRRLAFTWNAPPDQAYARAQRTIVNLDFQSVDARHTRLRFTHLGWGDGPEWDRAYSYFDHAWSAFVLPHLRHRLAHGAIDWNQRPQLPPVADSMKLTLSAAPAR